MTSPRFREEQIGDARLVLGDCREICAGFDAGIADMIFTIRPGHLGIRKIIPSADDHPTPKPPELARHFIRLHTQPGETVLDPFMGGGSTAIAAVKEGRKFVGIEIEERWFDMACARVERTKRQPDMFVPRATPPKQEVLFMGDPLLDRKTEGGE